MNIYSPKSSLRTLHNLRKSVVLELLFSAGLVAVLRSLVLVGISVAWESTLFLDFDEPPKRPRHSGAPFKSDD